MSSVIFALLLLVVGVLAVYIGRKIAFWRTEGVRVLTPGYLTPPPSLMARLAQSLVSRALIFFSVGKVRVVGAQNLKYGGRAIAYGNHQTERDAVLSFWMMGTRQKRYFIAVNQAQGWRAPLVAWTGGIVVDRASKYSAAHALKSSILSMTNEPESSFVIFPQGRLIPDNVLRREDFFPGIALLGEKVSAKSEMEVGYLPFAVYYDRDPAHATWIHRALNHIGWKSFRKFFGEVTYGAVVVIGEPIPVDVFPDDTRKATDMLFARLVELNAKAEQIGKAGWGVA